MREAPTGRGGATVELTAEENDEHSLAFESVEFPAGGLHGLVFAIDPLTDRVVDAVSLTCSQGAQMTLEYDDDIFHRCDPDKAILFEYGASRRLAEPDFDIPSLI